VLIDCEMWRKWLTLHSNVDPFLSVLWHCLLGNRKGIRPVKTGCWFVGGDAWLQLCTSYSSSCHHSPPPSPWAPITSRRHSATGWPRSAWKMAVKMERESNVDSVAWRQTDPDDCIIVEGSASVQSLCQKGVLWNFVDCVHSSCHGLCRPAVRAYHTPKIPSSVVISACTLHYGKRTSH